MRKLTIILMFLIVSTANGAMTNTVTGVKPTSYWWTGTPMKDTALLFDREVETLLEGTAAFDNYLIFEEIAAPSGNPSDNQGWLYTKDNGGISVLYFEDKDGTVTSCIAGAGTPAGSDTQMQYNNAGAFGAISTIIWDDTNLELANDQSLAFGTEADWTVNFDDSVDDQLIFLTAATTAGETTDPLFEIIVGATPTANQQVFGVSKGTQSSNTALFAIDEDGDTAIAGALNVTGVFTAASFTGDITLSNGETITNTTNSEIKFLENTGSEDLILDMDAGTNAVGLKSGSGVDELAMGAVDDLTGVGTIVFDAAASSISLAADGADDNLTLTVTGAQASSVIITSEGTGADAIDINTSAGGIDIDIAGAGSDEDFSVTTDSSIHFTPTQAVADSFEVSASGGIDMTAVDDIALTCASTTDADDLVITQTGANNSSISLQAAGNGADAINIDATAGGVAIDAVDDLILTCASTTTADDILIQQTGAQDASIMLAAAGTGADAIDLNASAGSIDIDAAVNITVNSAGDDITLQVDSDGAGDDLSLIVDGDDDAQIILNSDGTAADCILIQQNTAVTGGIRLHANDSTANADAASSIQLLSDLGAIGIKTSLAHATAIDIDSTAGGIDVDAADDINILLTAGGANEDIIIATTGSQDSHVSITADGTSANALGLFATGTAGGIDVATTDGKISIESEGAENGDIDIDASDDLAITAAGDCTFAVTGTLSMGGALLTNQGLTTEAVAGTTDVLTAAQSGSLIVYTQTGGACTVTLPDAAAGLWYMLVDGNPVGGNDLAVDPQVGDAINGDGAGEKITCENDRDGEAVIIFAVDGVNWYTIACGSSTVWTEE